MRQTVLKLLLIFYRLMDLLRVRRLLENFDDLIFKMHGEMTFYSSMHNSTMHSCLYNIHWKRFALNSKYSKAQLQTTVVIFLCQVLCRWASLQRASKNESGNIGKMWRVTRIQNVGSNVFIAMIRTDHFLSMVLKVICASFIFY